MIKILWIDDEIDFFHSHIIFLEQKGFEVIKAKSGAEGLIILDNSRIDVILIDQNMPGLAGTETIKLINEKFDQTPIVMISQNSDDNTIDQAIGNRVKDYIIKPINPNQVLLTLRKILSKKELINNTTLDNYQKKYQEINNLINECSSLEDWKNVYKTLVKWEIKLSNTDDVDIVEIIMSQKKYANNLFSSFIEKNYQKELENESFVSSINIFKKHVFPNINRKESTLLILIDNFRYDQWKMIEGLITENYTIDEEFLYTSILPTTTQYSRNSIFSGLSPLQIKKKYPSYWVDEFDNTNKNKFENQLLEDQLTKLGLKFKHKFIKISNSKDSKSFNKNLINQQKFNLTTVVYNFIDMISHAKKDVKLIKELASTDKAYRELTLTWFKNSDLYDTIKKSKDLGFRIIITSDHGTINVDKPSKVSGAKKISNNLRYKTSDQIIFNSKDVIEFKNPNSFELPSYNLNSSFIFARNNTFFVYPNNYNEYVSMYKDSYQHGGVSLEEMLVPFLILSPKR
tara:strand:+ start:7452 stop:8993 length:1542 start_codon:yes stop_codon:yes gene_type:complete